MAGASSTPPNSLNYASFGVNPVVEAARIEGQVTTAVFPKYETFDQGIDMKTDDDEGHTGTDILLLGKDRTEASAAPSFKDKIRLGEGFEDLAFMLLGKHDEVVAAVVGATTAKKWVIYRDVSDPEDLAWCTILQGFNWDTATAEAYVEAMVNTLEMTFDANASPTYKADFVSDFPLYNQDEPTLTYPSTEHRFKTGQTSIYLAPVGTAESTIITGSTYLADCYTNASLTLSNNMETSICGGVTFGQSNKDQKPFTGKGKIKMDYNSGNMNLEAEWATGSTSGTTPTQDSLFKAMVIKVTGKLIETVSGPPNVPVYMDLQIFLPKVEIIKPTSPRSGKDKKTVEYDYEVVNYGTTDPVTMTIITPLAAIHYGTAV